MHLPALGRARFELTAEVLNLLNLFNDGWGWVRYPAANAATTIGYGGVDPASGKPIDNIAALTSPTFLGTFVRDDLKSRWRGRWGIRVRF